MQRRHLRNSTSFQDKNSHVFGTKAIRLIIITAIFDKPTASIIFSGEKLKAFSLRPGTIQGCLLSHLFNIVLEVPVLEMTVLWRFPVGGGLLFSSFFWGDLVFNF